MSENRDLAKGRSNGGIRAAGARGNLMSRSPLFESPYAEQLKNMREEEYLQLLDLTPLFVTVLGPRRQRLYINRMGLDYPGTTTDRWRETLPSAELHPEDLEPVQHYWNPRLSDQPPFRM